MKQCPQCNRTYSDETLTFCLADGGLLSAPFDPQQTLLLPVERITNPTEVLPTVQPLPKSRGRSKTFYAIIALAIVLAVITAGVIIVPRIGQEQKNTNSQPITKTGRDALIDNWQGQWASPFGAIYTASLNLEGVDSGNNVQGQINWTMKSIPDESKKSKIGMTAVEYVKGYYDPISRLLVMEGYKEDDPNDIISLDKYRLILTGDNKTLAGATWNHGQWRGGLSLSH